jgi:sugar phosphate isomerase/epimerase
MGAVDYSSLKSIPISFATCSLGSPSNPPPLLDRLNAISAAGFTAVELSFPDILAYGQTWLGHEVEPKNFDELCKVAAEIKKECDKRQLGIMMLQPFSNVGNADVQTACETYTDFVHQHLVRGLAGRIRWAERRLGAGARLDPHYARSRLGPTASRVIRLTARETRQE